MMSGHPESSVASPANPNNARAPARVAIVAVHGVGDPGAGTTSRTFQKLLLDLNGRRGADIYSDFVTSELSVPVRPMQVKPTIPGARPFKDTFDETGPEIRGLQQTSAQTRAANSRPLDTLLTQDMVSGLTDLGPEATYETIRATTTRTKNGQSTIIDLYECYWADLMRVGGGLQRSLSAIYQILLHVPALGQRDLDIARIRDPGWKYFDRCQDIAVRIFALFVPILNLLLLGLGSIVIPLYPTPSIQFKLGWVLLVVEILLVAGLLRFRFNWWRWCQQIAVITAVSLVFVGLRWALRRNPCDYSRLLAFTWFVLIAIAIGCIIKAYAQMRQGAALIGGILSIPIGICALLAVICEPQRADLLGMICALVFLSWAVLVLAWILLFLASLTAWIVGHAKCLRDCAKGTKMAAASGRRMAQTARITLALGSVLFFLISLLAWFGLIGLLNKFPSETIAYPGWLSQSLQLLRQIQPACPFAKTPVASFAEMLVDPFRASALIVAMFIILAVVVALWALLPAVLTDVIFPTPPKGKTPKFVQRLGYSLTSGLNLLPWAGELLVLASWLIVPMALLPPSIQTRFLPQLAPILSVDLFALLAGTGIALAGQLDSIASRIGPVLTAALDIDAYMRLFPRDDNGRGRVFTRFVAILRMLCREKYQRIIFVTHSQGTVITADLFRFLKSCPDPALDTIGFGSQKEGCIPLDLITAGSPLRQLYHLRFPYLYDWVDGPQNPPHPDPAALGVKRWTNFFRAGDYIGRWLWKKVAIDAPFQVAHREDINLGGGGHVHYFDEHGLTVAEKIDDFI
jgi:hypothetical protein